MMTTYLVSKVKRGLSFIDGGEKISRRTLWDTNLGIMQQGRLPLWTYGD